MPRQLSILLARARDALLSPNPPKDLSSRRLALYAFLALVFSLPFGMGNPGPTSTIRFLAQQNATGAWVAPPVPGGSNPIFIELSVSDWSGSGWWAQQIDSSLGISTPSYVPSPWASAFDLWKSALDANDLSTTHTTGDPRTLTEMRDILAALVAREKTNPNPLYAGRPLELGEGLTLRALQRRVWILPALALAAVPFLAAYRASRPAQWRGELAMLGHGLCPKCRYSRTGLPDSAPCPECGCDPEHLKQNYQRYLDQHASRRLDVPPDA